MVRASTYSITLEGAAVMAIVSTLTRVLVAFVPGPHPWARAAVIQVPGDHSTIQSAIDAATPGDEILVAPGSYIETIDFKGEAVALRSRNSANKGAGIRNYIDAHPSFSDGLFSHNAAFAEGGGMDNRKNATLW